MLDSIEEFRNLFAPAIRNVQQSAFNDQPLEKMCFALKELYQKKGVESNIWALLQTFQVDLRDGNYHSVDSGIDEIYTLLRSSNLAEHHQFLE